MTLEDDALLAALRENEPGAWEQLLDRYGPLALSVPMRMGLPMADAEEVCQATWVILHRHVAWIERPGSLAAWILTTAGRETVRLRRARRRHQSLENEAALQAREGSLLPRDELDRLERLQRVGELAATMPNPCRRLLHKLYFDPREPSYAEIASALKLPIGSIGPMRARCLARLARKLQARERRTVNARSSVVARGGGAR